MQQIIFEDAQDSIRALFDSISIKNLPLQNAVLVAIGRDGVVYAHTLAQMLKVPMEFLFTQMIPAPHNPECSIAVVSEDMEIVINEELVSAFNISLDYVYGEAQRQYEEAILPARYQLRKGEGLSSLKGKDVLLFDMGIETGFRMGVAIKTCMNMEAKNLYAIAPVMPKEIYTLLCEICDEVCCPYPVENYVSTTHYFPNLPPLSDEAFEDILSKNTITKDT
ncbi:phosphoribosyltransferase [Helicobacter mastomyrinus]|uniref:Phosphoribosyltransferase family protein n=2 Tax=Helicobacter TaxID=209 RepID=A0ABZ3F5V2_9HELI|nr:phosphoribosyltransferase family protein [uncultured Helicobacter sp.]